MIASLVTGYYKELAGDVDDIFYNADKQEIIASGGDGSINIFKKENGTSSY